MTEPSYSYRDIGVLIHEDYEGYNQTLEELREGLSDQAAKEEISVPELRREDDWIDVPYLEGEGELDDVFRYRIDDEFESRAVYIFDHHQGKMVLGDSTMVACAGDLGLAPLMEEPIR